MLPGKCPACGQMVGSLRLHGVDATESGMSIPGAGGLKAITLCCPNLTCGTVLGAQIDPIAVRTEIVAQTAADISDLEREAELIKAQREHQADTMGMSFFPFDGRCPHCRARLVDVIPEVKLRTENITGCPLCDSTFVG